MATAKKINVCVNWIWEFEVKIFADVSWFEYPLSLLPVCYHGTGRIILAYTVTSRAQACQKLCGNTEEKTSKYKLTHILGCRHVPSSSCHIPPTHSMKLWHLPNYCNCLFILPYPVHANIYFFRCGHYTPAVVLITAFLHELSRHHLAISRQRTQRSCDIFINQLVKKKITKNWDRQITMERCLTINGRTWKLIKGQFHFKRL
jgi:hypothetical protein